MDLNEVTLSGRLVHDPKVAFTSEGVPFVTCTLAVERKEPRRPFDPAKDGVAAQARAARHPAQETQRRYTHIPIHAIGVIAEKAAGQLSEGARILVKGFLRRRQVSGGPGSPGNWVTDVEMTWFLRFDAGEPEAQEAEGSDDDEEFF